MKRNKMKKRTPKKDVIRVGDVVKIKEPNMFVRCGYPLSFEDMRKDVEKKHSADISKFLYSLKIPCGGNYFDINQKFKNSREFDKIRDALAYYFLKQCSFGGNERTIHTKVNETYRNTEAIVVAIQFVKTGTYSPGYHGGFWDDNEPSALYNQETHKILHVRLPYAIYGNDYPKIEACWVEKLVDFSNDL
jgi:hypothetical protein